MTKKQTTMRTFRLSDDDWQKVTAAVDAMANRKADDINKRRGYGGKYSTSDFIRAAIREKLAHLARSRRATKCNTLPSDPPSL